MLLSRLAVISWLAMDLPMSNTAALFAFEMDFSACVFTHAQQPRNEMPLQILRPVIPLVHGFVSVLTADQHILQDLSVNQM